MTDTDSRCGCDESRGLRESWRCRKCGHGVVVHRYGSGQCEEVREGARCDCQSFVPETEGGGTRGSIAGALVALVDAIVDAEQPAPATAPDSRVCHHQRLAATCGQCEFDAATQRKAGVCLVGPCPVIDPAPVVVSTQYLDARIVDERNALLEERDILRARVEELQKQLAERQCRAK